MFRRFLNKNDVLHLFEARFPKETIAQRILIGWSEYIIDASEEAEEAFRQLSTLTWWKVPKKILFTGYGGIGFIPDDVLSYYLPGCIYHGLIPTIDMDAIDIILFQLAGKSYAFQALNNNQVLAVGWFVYYLSLRSDHAYDGRLAIIKVKIDNIISCMNMNNEKAILYNAFESVGW